MTLRKQVEMAGINAVQIFKALQSFIDSCAKYYGTGFEDYLKQVALAFLELDLSGITMDDLEPMMLVGNIIVDKGDGPPKSNLPPKDDGAIVLAQRAANPPHVSTSNPPIVPVYVENPHSWKKDNGNPTDAPAA